MSVVYVSSLEAGKTCLELVKGKLPFDYILTIDAALAERARVSGYADFRDMGIPVRYLTRYSMKTPEDEQLVRCLAPDLLVVSGWNRLIPQAILDLPRCGAVGLHGSAQPLPNGRGRSPVTWALESGATQFFLHLYYLDGGPDSGDIIATVCFDITPTDTAATVLAKIGIMSASLLTDNVPRILDGTAPRTPQAGEPTYLRRRTPEEGRIDWTMPIDAICNRVRAGTHPYSGAFCDVELRGRVVTMRIWDAVVFSRTIDFDSPPGAIVLELDGKPLIKCTDGILLVKDFSI